MIETVEPVVGFLCIKGMKSPHAEIHPPINLINLVNLLLLYEAIFSPMCLDQDMEVLWNYWKSDEQE